MSHSLRRIIYPGATIAGAEVDLPSKLVFANTEATKATHAQADIWIYDWATSSTRVARTPPNARPERPPQRTLVLIQITGRGCVHMGQFGEVLGLEGPKEDLFEVLDFDTRILLCNAKKGFLTF